MQTMKKIASNPYVILTTGIAVGMALGYVAFAPKAPAAPSTPAAP